MKRIFFYFSCLREVHWLAIVSIALPLFLIAYLKTHGQHWFLSYLFAVASAGILLLTFLVSFSEKQTQIFYGNLIVLISLSALFQTQLGVTLFFVAMVLGAWHQNLRASGKLIGRLHLFLSLMAAVVLVQQAFFAAIKFSRDQKFDANGLIQLYSVHTNKGTIYLEGGNPAGFKVPMVWESTSHDAMANALKPFGFSENYSDPSGARISFLVTQKTPEEFMKQLQDYLLLQKDFIPVISVSGKLEEGVLWANILKQPKLHIFAARYRSEATSIFSAESHARTGFLLFVQMGKVNWTFLIETAPQATENGGSENPEYLFYKIISGFH